MCEDIIISFYYIIPSQGLGRCSLKTGCCVGEREVSLSGEKWMSAAKCVCESYVYDGWMDTVVERDEY